jgi:hypothetical protein
VYFSETGIFQLQKDFMMNFIEHGADIIDDLKNREVTSLSREAFDARVADISSRGDLLSSLLLTRDAFQHLPGWCHAMAAVFQDDPDENGKVATILSNHETLTALLAVRAGINMHLAVELTYENMIIARPIVNGVVTHCEIDPDEAAILATFSHSGQNYDSVALIADLAVLDFESSRAPSELILFDQHPIEGLHQPFSTDYFESHLAETFEMRTGLPAESMPAIGATDLKFGVFGYPFRVAI